MHVTPTDELRQILRVGELEDTIDNQSAIREKKRIAEDFRRQLTFGTPTNQDETTLRACQKISCTTFAKQSHWAGVNRD